MKEKGNGSERTTERMRQKADKVTDYKSGSCINALPMHEGLRVGVFLCWQCPKRMFKIKLYLHLSLSMSFPAHIVANATLMENTRILPTFSLQKQIKMHS